MIHKINGGGVRNSHQFVKFMRRVRLNRESGCWEWTAGRHGETGYGAFSTGPNSYGAHRVSYCTFKGPIPRGLVVDHICNNRICVNPHHLKLATIGDNAKRGERSPQGINARKTHCIYGHELSGANLITKRNGKRRCRICTNRLKAESQRRMREQRQQSRRA